MSDSKIKSKIMALLAKAKGTENEHEAEIFLSKAMSLMEQHQLDIVDMVGEDDPIIRHVGLKGATSGHAWRRKLYSALAQLYGCKSIRVVTHVVGKNGRWVEGYEQTLVGRESAIVTTDLIYPWVVSQIRLYAKNLAPQTGLSEQGQAKRVAAALISRVSVLVRANRERAPNTAAGRNALVVTNAVQAAFDKHFPSVISKQARGAKTDSLSRAAADSIGLHRQTGAGSTLRLGGK